MCPQRAGRPQQDGEDACPHREQWVRERGMGLSEPRLPEGKPHRMELGTRMARGDPSCRLGLSLNCVERLSTALGRAWSSQWYGWNWVQPQPQREEGPVCSWGRQRRRRVSGGRVSVRGSHSPEGKSGESGLRTRKLTLLHAHCCWVDGFPEERFF